MHHLLRVLVGLPAHDLRLALGALDPALGLGARAGADLVGGLVCALEDARGLLANLVERALNHGLAGLPALELGHELERLLDELVHRATVVAAHDHRERPILQAVGGAAGEAGGTDVGGVGVGHDSQYAP